MKLYNQEKKEEDVEQFMEKSKKLNDIIKK